MALTDTAATPVAPAPADDLKPATDMAPSGAMIEPEIVERVPFEHPAIDNNPRAGQPEISNHIEMNDPTKPGHVVVAERLGLGSDYDSDEKQAAAEKAAKKA